MRLVRLAAATVGNGGSLAAEPRDSGDGFANADRTNKNSGLDNPLLCHTNVWSG